MIILYPVRKKSSTGFFIPSSLHCKIKENKFNKKKVIIMIKTSEQFKRSTTKPIYSLEEFEAICGIIYDIVSDSYDEDDIGEFIYSSDVEAKEQFIAENKIENLLVCKNCGKFIVEGCIYRDKETFCSNECLMEKYGEETGS